MLIPWLSDVSDVKWIGLSLFWMGAVDIQYQMDLLRGRGSIGVSSDLELKPGILLRLTH